MTIETATEALQSLQRRLLRKYGEGMAELVITTQDGFMLTDRRGQPLVAEGEAEDVVSELFRD